MTTILVAGGAGYLGAVLCETLLDAGYRVTILDALFFGPRPLARLRRRPGVRLVCADIRDAPPRLLEGVDVVVHLAAVSNDPACDLNPQFSRDINVEGTIRLAKLSKMAGVGRFVFSSSCSVYGRGSDTLDEGSPVSPISLYGRTKAEAEDAVLRLSDRSFAVTVLRNATMYGVAPRMRFDLVVNHMTLCAHTAGKVSVCGGQQWRPLVHVRDAARATVSTIEAPRQDIAGEVFNLGSNDQNFEVRDLARTVQGLVPGTEIDVSYMDPDQRSYRVSFDRLHRTLGFDPKRRPADGIREVKAALEQGVVDTGIRTRTVEYYRHLLADQGLGRRSRLDAPVS